jgi:hypothetical protein
MRLLIGLKATHSVNLVILQVASDVRQSFL